MLLDLLQRAAASVLDWSERAAWSIEEQAWERITGHGVTPALVFCYPTLLEQEPALGTYYRSLALLPQKGLARLSGISPSFEERPNARLTRQRALGFARVVNTFNCQLALDDPDWNCEEARCAALLNLGSQINGSWRDQIGIEGTRRVKRLVLALLRERAAIAQIRGAGGRVVPAEEATGENVREILLTNGYRVVFGSEPDIGVYDDKDVPMVTVEVKAGLDPAGALERYGAATKSFRHAADANARVHNILLASCVTAEMRRRMNSERLVSADFNLTAVLERADARELFLHHLARHLNLP